MVGNQAMMTDDNSDNFGNEAENRPSEAYYSAIHLSLMALTIVFSLLLITFATINTAYAQTAQPMLQSGQFVEKATPIGRKIGTIPASKAMQAPSDTKTGRTMIAGLLIFLLGAMLLVTHRMWDALVRQTGVDSTDKRRGKKLARKRSLILAL
jgi:hypothetical protein